MAFTKPAVKLGLPCRDGGMRGDIYGDNPAYPPDLEETGGSLDNADSLAWTAVSLATGAVRMQINTSTDFENCPGAAL